MVMADLAGRKRGRNLRVCQGGPSAATVGPCPQGSPEIPAVGGVVDVGAQEGVHLLSAGDIPGIKDLAGRRVKGGAGMPVFCPPVGISKTGKLPVEEGLQWGPPRDGSRQDREGRAIMEELLRKRAKTFSLVPPLPAGIGERLSRTQFFPRAGLALPLGAQQGKRFRSSHPPPPPTNLQLVPLDAAQAARRVAPGVLGTEDQLGLQQLVSAGGGDLLLHLLETLVVGLGLSPGEEREDHRGFRTVLLCIVIFETTGRMRLGE